MTESECVPRARPLPGLVSHPPRSSHNPLWKELPPVWQTGKRWLSAVARSWQLNQDGSRIRYLWLRNSLTTHSVASNSTWYYPPLLRIRGTGLAELRVPQHRPAVQVGPGLLSRLSIERGVCVPAHTVWGTVNIAPCRCHSRASVSGCLLEGSSP